MALPEIIQLNLNMLEAELIQALLVMRRIELGMRKIQLGTLKDPTASLRMVQVEMEMLSAVLAKLESYEFNIQDSGATIAPSNLDADTL